MRVIYETLCDRIVSLILETELIQNSRRVKSIVVTPEEAEELRYEPRFAGTDYFYNRRHRPGDAIGQIHKVPIHVEINSLD